MPTLPTVPAAFPAIRPISFTWMRFVILSTAPRLLNFCDGDAEAEDEAEDEADAIGLQSIIQS